MDTISTFRPVRGAWMIMPLPRYIATWWMDDGLLVVPQKTRSPGRSCEGLIGVDAEYCATE